MSTTTSTTAALLFQPSSMSTAQLAAVSFLARYSGATHVLYQPSWAAGSPGARPRGWTRWSGFSEPTSSSTSATWERPV